MLFMQKQDWCLLKKKKKRPKEGKLASQEHDHGYVDVPVSDLEFLVGVLPAGMPLSGG
jgi:hypothetical protein